MNDIDPNAAYVHSLELERTALKITVAELEGLLADARAELERVAGSMQAGSDRGTEHAARAIEAALRRADVCEVRLWGSSWSSGIADSRVSVTLTLRNGRGEIHGGTLADALLHAKEAR